MSEIDALTVLNLILVVAIAGAWVYLRDASNAQSNDRDEMRRRLAMIAFPGGDVLLTRPDDGIGEREPTLRVAGRSDPNFVENACAAYERIVNAMARDDLRPVEHLLTNETRLDFAGFLAARRIRGEAASLTFIGFRAVELLDSGVEGQTAWAEMRFATDLVLTLRDREGNVIEGDPRRIKHCAERWTFERDLRQRAPRWLLAATDTDG
jgi:predicted lipid-binding transport protein (Tim44 family)